MQRLGKFGQQLNTDLVFCVALAGLSLVFYALTLAPTMLEGDSGEFQSLLRTLGIVHTTGYPLYTLVGHAFTWLPFGDVAYRVNAFSAAAGRFIVFRTRGEACCRGTSRYGSRRPSAISGSTSSTCG